MTVRNNECSRNARVQNRDFIVVYITKASRFNDSIQLLEVLLLAVTCCEWESNFVGDHDGIHSY